MKENPKNLLTKTLITLILALTLTWFYAAQARADGTISGTVIQDPWTSDGVTVKVTGNGITPKSTTAGSNDRFSVTVPAGTGYVLTLSKAGYYDKTITGITIADGQTVDFSTNGGGRDIFLYQTMQITTAPQNQAVSLGETACFQFAVYFGVQPYIYQWFKDGKYLTGGNWNCHGNPDAFLRIPNVSSADRGAYTVVCTDMEGHTITASATLKVNDLRIRSSGFGSASSLAVDNQNGSVYLADSGFIKVIKNDGETVTLKTSFKAQRMTLDNAGNIYAVGTINGSDYFLYKISADGSTTAIPVPFDNDWGGIAVDGSGNIYISRRFSNLIRKVTINPDGTSAATELDSGSTNWYGIAADQAGNVYVIDDVNKVVKKIAVSGAITTWGSGFSDPRGVAADQAGNLYVTDGSTVKKIAPDGQMLPDVATGLNYASTVIVGSDGTVYVRNSIGLTGGCRLQKITPEGKIIIIGITVGPYSGRVTTVDSSGNVYIADRGVRIFTPDGILFPYGDFLPGDLFDADCFTGSTMDGAGNTYVSTNCGGVYKFPKQGSGLLFATITYPRGIIVDDSGYVYVLEQGPLPWPNSNRYAGNFTLRIYNSSGGTSIRDIPGFTGGAMTQDSNGHIYIAGGATITEINAADLSTVTKAADLTPVRTITGFNYLQGIAVDGDGTIYVTEAGNNAVKEITPDGKIIVWDSLNNDGYYTDSSGHFYQPSGINLDSQGNLYVIDGKQGLTVIRPVLGVAYDGNGSNSGSVPADPGNYYYGQSATALGQNGLIRQGYSFTGWNTAADGSGEQYAPGAQLPIRRNNVTLYARWTPVGPVHAVNLTAAAGGTVSGGGNYAEGATVTVIAASASGYTFVNWAGSGVPVCTNPLYTFTLGQSDVSLTANFRLTASGNVTIDIAAVPGVKPLVVDLSDIVNYLPDTAQYFGYVTWSPWDPNNAIVQPNTVYTATITLAPKPGYTLAGVPANFFRVAGATSVSNAAGSGVITAVFPATGSSYVSYYYLHFESGSSGGIATGTDGYYPVGMAITITAAPYKNYRFDKWSCTGGGSIANANNATTTFIMPAGDVTITANYKLGAGTSRVSYDGNGNDGGNAPADANNYVYGQTAAVLGNTGSLRKNGYTFGGWNTATDGSGRSYAPGSYLDIGLNNIKLYARWIVNPTYTIAAINNQDLTTMTTGYAAGSQETRTITITRTGSGDLFNLAVSLSGSNAGSFSITQPVVTVLNQGTPAATFTVKAKDGLAAGTYTATVTVTATNMTGVGFTITQQVNDPNLSTVATPSFIIPGGSYNTAQTVPIICATDGAEIRYTVDGNDPTQASALYTGPVLIAATTTLKAQAFKSGCNPSAIASQTFTINGTIGQYQPGNSDSTTSPNQLLTARNIEGDLSVQYNSATLWLGKGLNGKLTDLWLDYPQLIGSGTGQIPTTAKIVSAKLVLTVKDFKGNAYLPHKINLYQITDPDGLGVPYFGSNGLRNGLDFQYRDHRPGRNIKWRNNDTNTDGLFNINDLINGITPVDTYEAIPAVFTAQGYTQIQLDVTASIKDWLGSDLKKANQGWFLNGDQAVNWGFNDGVEFYGVADPTPANRPKLEVTFVSASEDNVPPNAVTIQSATPGYGQVTLNWTNPSADFCGVLILRKAGVIPAGPTDGTVIFDGIATTKLDNQGLTNDKSYYYAIFAYDNLRNYSKKAWIAAIPKSGTGIKPADPSGLTISLSGNSLRFNWSDNSSNEDSFVVEQKEGTGSFTPLVTVGANQNSLTLKIDDPNFSLKPSITYQYRIKAVNTYGDSGYAATSSGITTAAFPAAPDNLSWTIISAGRVNLSWSDIANNETGYRIDVCQNDSGKTVLWSINNLPANTTIYSVTGLTPGTEYLFKIVAVNTAGESAVWTEPITTSADFKGGLL